MVLLRGAELGVEGAREALDRGFRWILGDNELGTCMIDREARIIYRSVGRTGRLERPRRLLASYRRQWAGTEGQCAPASELAIERECRSYHLGWILWTFAGRDDLAHLAGHPAFSTG